MKLVVSGFSHWRVTRFLEDRKGFAECQCGRMSTKKSFCPRGACEGPADAHLQGATGAWKKETLWLSGSQGHTGSSRTAWPEGAENRWTPERAPPRRAYEAAGHHLGTQAARSSRGVSVNLWRRRPPFHSKCTLEMHGFLSGAPSLFP